STARGAASPRLARVCRMRASANSAVSDAANRALAPSSRITTSNSITDDPIARPSARAQLVPSGERRYAAADHPLGVEQDRFAITGDTADAAYRHAQPPAKDRGGKLPAEAEQQLVIVAAAKGEPWIAADRRAVSR